MDDGFAPAARYTRAEDTIMTLMQWLNKLGILRWGTKAAVYRNATKKPIELMDVGVYNAERDLMWGGEKKPPPKNTAAETFKK